ncbi:heterocyst frequency control protein PatD [Cyanobacterium stanieri LEGE 03274]|uniref:Heterocyst frequency control protein PatD n=1 Tax=Cyanobacterium stanieri LEGE 03274 TaxID=1828756 RepID=A0ABR9UZU0_9CHRO|nr:heterocyst frequency control protein PatD [Cyanobacterium stanieri]MBE9221160.1 heterocyst frequency control protein PatD [Cyanobacterium stanieri LEGE 03274]
MLSKSHFSIVKDWVFLLKDFQSQWNLQKINNYYQTSLWQKINGFLQSEIMSLNEDDFPLNNIPQWQSWQTETYRFIRLLNTELLFFASAKQPHTKQLKTNSISQKLQGAIALSENLLNQAMGNGNNIL